MRSRILLTAVAHVAGAVAAWGLLCLEAAVVYTGLVASALIAGADPGGPLAGPVMVLCAAVAGAVLTVVVLLPAVLIGRAARRFSWPAALAIAAVLLALLVTAPGLTTDPARTWVILAAAGVTPLTVWCAVVAVLTRRPAEPAPADDWWFPPRP